MIPISAVDKSQHILVLAPFGKDAAHLCKVIESAGNVCIPCKNIDELMENLTDDIGAVLLTEEVLSSTDAKKIVDGLKRQPTWSAVPVIIFYSQSATLDGFQKKATHPLHELTDINLLQRPVSVSVLVSAIRSALRDRQRQYRIRDLLVQLQNDIERRKVYESELKEANFILQEARNMAQQASRSKSQFLANMSHEIRTPLGAIIGFLDLLKSPLNSKEEISSYISVISRNSLQLLRLIDDILDISKVEAGKMIIESLPFSLTELLSDFSSIMGFKAKEKNIEFKLNIKNALPEQIISDPTRLRQVITNMVGNAIKFTESGLVILDVHYVNQTLRFTVTDTGRGISKDQSALLFQPFTQADSSTTRRYGGTGLGLVLTKRICNEMGGNFFLQRSEIGQGSVFVATLKTCDPGKNKIRASEGHQNSSIKVGNPLEGDIFDGLRVLLVEDMPDNQALISIMLKRLGADVSLANNGREAVASVLYGQYDVLLMDIQMPFMDGHEAATLIRKEGFKIPIIALTAHAMKEEQARSKASGFDDFLTKPIDRVHLVKTLLKYKSGIH